MVEVVTRDSPHRCPDANELAAFVDRRLSGDVRTLVEQHVRGCRTCREVVRETAWAAAPWVAQILRRWPLRRYAPR